MARDRQRVNGSSRDETGLSGQVIVGELIRNMELGRFEMAYTVLLPCVFTVYLNPADYATLSGVLEFVVEDARKALRARVAELNGSAGAHTARKRVSKDHRIACREWELEFLPNEDIPAGDVEIHSTLNEAAPPGFRGTRTTLIGREATGGQSTGELKHAPQTAEESIYAAIRYEDDAGPRTYFVTGNQVRVGRGGDDQPVELALSTTDEISRQHLVIKRNPSTGAFSILDASTNGTWVNGRRMRRGSEDPLPRRAEIGLGEVLTLDFEVRT
ncbi:MAG: FHA domain-containing protein [Acidobacteriota bacterium]|nr:FHA domain-containing protein [Acidobacteriota bacterium]